MCADHYALDRDSADEVIGVLSWGFQWHQQLTCTPRAHDGNGDSSRPLPESRSPAAAACNHSCSAGVGVGWQLAIVPGACSLM